MEQRNTKDWQRIDFEGGSNGAFSEGTVRIDPVTGEWLFETDMVLGESADELAWAPRYEEIEVRDDADRYLIASIAEHFGVEHAIIALHGPGGGWPVIQFQGTPNAVRQLLAWFFDDARLTTLDVR